MTNETDSNKKTLGETFGIFFAVLFAIIVPISFYTFRCVHAMGMVYPLTLGILYLFVGLISGPIISIATAAIYVLGWLLNRIKPGYSDILPLLVAVSCAIAIAYFIPVIPTPEQAFFYQHEIEFEHQVELFKYAQPISDHYYLGSYGNLGIYTLSPSNAIAFAYFANDSKSAYAYVYAEQYSDLDYFITCSARGGSGGDGQIYTQMSANWYLCYRTAT